MHSIRSLLGPVAVICALSLPSLATADFSGPYSPSNWTLDLFGTPPAGDSTVDTSGAPAQIFIEGGNSGCGEEMLGLGRGESEPQGAAPFPDECYLTYAVTTPAGGSINFTWNYVTSDVDGPSFERFGYVLNGAFTQLTDDGGADTQSGTESVAVSAGDQFGLVFDCTDCFEGPADVTISGFGGPGQASTTSVPVNSPIALIALIALMAGLGVVAFRLRA